ncbi:hypothetical protein KKH18_10585, partial [bacterium]|nr:hypothetical protein [bacterium]
AATAIGNYLCGLIGGWWDTMPHSKFFLILVFASLGAAALLFLVIKHIRPTIQEAEAISPPQ